MDATGRNGAEEIIDSAGYVRATCPFEMTTSLNTSISGGHASTFTLNIPYGHLWPYPNNFEALTPKFQALLGLAGHSLTVGTLAWQVRGECRAFEFSVHSKGRMNHN